MKNSSIITIKYNKVFEETIQNSKFITNIFHIDSEEEAKEIIKDLNQRFYDATHNCFAYIVGNIERFSDDGEPSKTAGYPILEAIKYAKLTDVLIVVTRYFGGTLLGTGGLIRAYGSGAKNVIDISEKFEYIKGKKVLCTFDYKYVDIIKNFCEKNILNISNEKYMEYVEISIEIPENKLEEFISFYSNLIGKSITKEDEKFKIIKDVYILKDIEI